MGVCMGVWGTQYHPIHPRVWAMANVIATAFVDCCPFCRRLRDLTPRPAIVVANSE